MDEGSRNVQKAISLTDCAQKKQAGHVSEASSNGVMDESSGKVHKAKTHPKSFIMVDLAAVQLHVGDSSD